VNQELLLPEKKISGILSEKDKTDLFMVEIA
jgi:hypothetical protein